MSGSFTTKTIKDSAGSDLTMRVWDESGAGTGPFSFGHVMAGQASTVVDVTLSLDTGGYADGDVLADTQSVASVFREAGGRVELQSVHVLDEDDNGIAFDLIFLNANTSLGSENSAPDITDSEARDIVGRVSIATGDYIDLGACRIADKVNIGLVMQATSASTTLYLGAITRGGTPTYTASGIKLKLAFRQL